MVSTGVLIGVLFLAFLILLFVVLRPPIPGVDRLVAFVALVIVAIILAYMFVTRIVKRDPDPFWLGLANTVTDNKMIDLTEVVPGLDSQLDWIHRLDTDGEPNDHTPLEWVVLYPYDTSTGVDKVTGEFEAGHVRFGSGPFGATIYDPGLCRPPAIRAFELVPIHYDYLGQNGVDVQVENVINDPSGRPEVILNGYTRQVVTDLNLFRKEGAEPNCEEVAAWRAQHRDLPLIYPGDVNYVNIGSFRGNYQVRRNGSTVYVYDSAGFERSQIVVGRQYRPVNDIYFTTPGGSDLLPPVEYGLEFGPGWPDNIPEVYYPEKAVLAFYLSLTKKENDLKRAKSYLSAAAAAAHPIDTDQFGLALPRSEVVRVLVWEMRYVPDAEAERLHRPRSVTATVVGVRSDGTIDRDHPCQVTWLVTARSNPQALPFQCEWQLDSFSSTCPPPGEHGELLFSPQELSQVVP